MVWLDRTVYVTIGYLCSRVQEPLKGTFLEVVSPESVDEWRLAHVWHTDYHQLHPILPSVNSSASGCTSNTQSDWTHLPHFIFPVNNVQNPRHQLQYMAFVHVMWKFPSHIPSISVTSSCWFERSYLSDASIMLCPTVSEDDLPLSKMTKPP